jgi:hypothetical protein
VHHIYNDEEMLRRLKHGSALVGLLALRDFKALLAKRERELLAKARAEGMPWLLIGGLLGVSRQAAAQRARRLGIDVEEEDWDEQANQPDGQARRRADPASPDQDRTV